MRMVLPVSPRPPADADVALELAGSHIRPRSPKVPCAAGAELADGVPDAVPEDAVADVVLELEDEHAAVTPEAHASATDNTPIRLSTPLGAGFICLSFQGRSAYMNAE